VAPTTATVIRKVTVSLPRELLEYVDGKAALAREGRSRVIAEVLAAWRASEKDALAVEGYRFYAQETSEFAETSLPAVREAISHAG